MANRLDQLPDNAFDHIIFNLDLADISALSCTCRALHAELMDDSRWQRKLIHDFGDLFQVYSILTKVAGLELPPDLTQKYAEPPSSWCKFYINKSMSASSNSIDESKLMDDADKEYQEAQKQLRAFQADCNMVVLQQVATKMIWILDFFPGHGGCYYILAFILFVLNKLEESIILLEMSRNVDPTFAPVDELQDEIERIMQGYQGDNEYDAPLIDQDALTQDVIDVLCEIFQSFDKDNDGALRPEELDNFIFATNGSHPPPAFLRQMGQRFGCSNKGWLTKDGFLAFYLEQTLDDPAETRNDLGVHGYNPHSLKKEMEQ